MEYLKEQFHNDLKSETNTYVLDGRIHMREMHWSPLEFLEIIQGDAYNQIFNEWFDERKQNYLQIAEEILNKYDNRGRFESLKQTFQAGVVIPFVGAGMSMPSQYPGWTQFLNDVCSETRVPIDELKKLLADGLYEEAAQMLFDDMGAASFNEHLRNVFGLKKDIKGPINYLPNIFKSGVITTKG